MSREREIKEGCERSKKSKTRGSGGRTTKIELRVSVDDIFGRNVDKLDALELNKRIERSVEVLELLELGSGILLSLGQRALRQDGHELVQHEARGEIIFKILNHQVDLDQMGITPSGEGLQASKIRAGSVCLFVVFEGPCSVALTRGSSQLSSRDSCDSAQWPWSVIEFITPMARKGYISAETGLMKKWVEIAAVKFLSPAGYGVPSCARSQKMPNNDEGVRGQEGRSIREAINDTEGTHSESDDRTFIPSNTVPSFLPHEFTLGLFYNCHSSLSCIAVIRLQRNLVCTE